MKLPCLVLLLSLAIQARSESLAEPIPSTVTNFTQAKAIVRAIRGASRYSETGEWKTTKVNSRLQSGTVIACDSDSSVDLSLNNSIIRVSPNTVLAIETLTTCDTGIERISQTRLILKQGMILGNVKKLAKDSIYEIKTAKGVVRIRGTDFVMCSSGKVGSIAGTITFSGAEEHTINTDEMFDPDKGAIDRMPLLELQGFMDCVPPHPDGGPLSILHNQSSPFQTGLLYARRMMSGVPMNHFFYPVELPNRHSHARKQQDSRIPQPLSDFCK